MEVARKQNCMYAQRTWELRSTVYYGQRVDRQELSNKDEVRRKLHKWRIDKLEVKEKREECQEEMGKMQSNYPSYWKD